MCGLSLLPYVLPRNTADNHLPHEQALILERSVITIEELRLLIEILDYIHESGVAYHTHFREIHQK